MSTLSADGASTFSGVLIGVAANLSIIAILDTIEKEDDITQEVIKVYDLELEKDEASAKEEESRVGNTNGNCNPMGRGTYAIHDVDTREKRLIGSEFAFVHYYLILDRFLCTTLLN